MGRHKKEVPTEASIAPEAAAPPMSAPPVQTPFDSPATTNLHGLQTPRFGGAGAAMAREPKLGKHIGTKFAFGQNRFVCNLCPNYEHYDLGQVQEHVRLAHAGN